MLEEQCASWGGPVSASIWLPLEYFNQQSGALIEEAIQQLGELHRRIEESGAAGRGGAGRGGAGRGGAGRGGAGRGGAGRGQRAHS